MMDLAVMYHYVLEPENWKGSVPISPENFRKQVQFLKENYIMVNSKNCNESLSKSKSVIAFDDATKDQYTNAYNILKEEGSTGYFAIMSGPLVEKKIPVFHLVHTVLSHIEDEVLWGELIKRFDIPLNIEEVSVIYSYEKETYRRYNKYVLNFLLSEKQCREFLEEKVQQFYGSLDEFIERFYINSQEIIEMYENGMEIGVHCVHHRPYGGDAQMFYEKEVQPCKEYLTELLGETPKWYSPAFGGGENTAQMLEELTPILKANGFIGGFTTIEGFCDMTYDDFWHKRVDCNKLMEFIEIEDLVV